MLETEETLKREKRDTIIDSALAGLLLVGLIISVISSSPYAAIACAIGLGQRLNNLGARARLVAWVKLAGTQERVIDKLTEGRTDV